MMKQLVRLLLVVAIGVVVTIACSKDDKGGSVAVNPSALFLDWGETASVHFSGDNIAEYSISATPTGWEEPVIDVATMTITVKAPAEGTEANETGTIRLRGRTHGNEYVHASLYVALNTIEVDYSAHPANCYLANKPNAHYIFDATRNGNGELLETASVAVIWQTSMNMLQYLSFNEGMASFYLVADADDPTQPKQGNALIGGYDAAGNLLWSWHIWATGFDPEASALDYGAYELMSRQLGAVENANDSQQAILDSYGVYYQWGRKDPFIGPSTYNASRGVAMTLFDAKSNTVKVKMVAADSETGNYAYTNANPTHYLTTTQKDASWLTSSVKGWSAQSKTVNDPCPYGWQVAPASVFDGLQIADDLTATDAASKYANAYGWNLTNGTTTSFFFAAGRRVYADGLIQNVYEESLNRNVATEFQPWVGYNWTADGSVFAFWFNKANPTASNLRNDLTMGYANGMSVRCVRTK
jgi:hypothetical protein